MEILFIGVANTEESLNEIASKYYNNIKQAIAQQLFDLTLVKGLSSFYKVKALTIPSVDMFPISKCIFYKRKSKEISNNLIIRYVTLINLPIIKNIMVMFSIFISVLFFGVKNRKKHSVILMGNISARTCLPAMLAAKLMNLKICPMVPEAPMYYTFTNIANPIKKASRILNSKINSMIQNKFDGYIFFTKEMDKLINQNNKPYIIIEGIINKADFVFENETIKESKKVIMYAGTLHLKYGIKKLIDAFKLINIKNSELWIFGIGDYLDEIKKISKSNENIQYKGSCSREEILKNECRATILVNPRSSDEEFTKYSFPSKTIEYMASGTPFLTARLPGIPDEYFDFVYTFIDETIEGMAKTMEEVLSKQSDELNVFGKKARNYVLENKDYLVQSKKIINFLEKIS